MPPAARLRMSHVLRLTPAALTAMLCVACSPSPFNADVSGVVKLDGETIGPGVVIFAPDTPGQNASRGAIDTNGRYFLKTKHDRGIDAGHYRVAVQVYDTSNPPPPGQRDFSPPKPIIPEKYLRVETAGLDYDVAAGGNQIDIDLSSAAP